MRNPPWAKDELILALDLYFRVDVSKLSSKDPRITELSDLLNKLNVHDSSLHQEKFRNPNGVYMKLMNFLRLDPSYTGKGLDQGSKMDVLVWEEYYQKKDELHQIASILKAGIMSESQPTSTFNDEEDSFPEGKYLYRYHKTRERNSALVNKVKKIALENNQLFCSVCNFDFFKHYGDHGHGYIECHHTNPISQYKDGEKTQLKDLALVCSNCHRMLHRIRPWLTIDELKKIVTENK